MSDLYAIPSEWYVIGAALQGDRTVFTHLLDYIEGPPDFYREAHRDTWRVIMELYREGKGIDLPIVTHHLPSESTASATMLSEMTSKVASTDPATVTTHAKIVHEKALARRVRHIAGGAIHDLEDDGDVFDVLDGLQGGLLDAQRGESGRSTSAAEGTRDVLEHLEAVDNAPSGVTGIPSGLKALDEITAGWQDGDLAVIAARPSMGKTSLALHMAHHAAQSGVGVGMFSVEMPSRQLYQRIITTEAGVDGQRARRGRLSEADWADVRDAAASVHDLPIHVDDRSGITPMQIRARAHEWASQHDDLGLLIVDYLQLMRPGVDKGTREQEVSYMSREMKGVARDIGVPVLLLSQLNRAVEKREDKHPQLSDLRASGAIEQDADVVAFIYRAERYGIDTDDQGRATDGVAEINVSKQRNGPVGRARVRFEERTGRWANLSSRAEPTRTPTHTDETANAPF